MPNRTNADIDFIFPTLLIHDSYSLSVSSRTRCSSWEVLLWCEPRTVFT